MIFRGRIDEKQTGAGAEAKWFSMVACLSAPNRLQVSRRSAMIETNQRRSRMDWDVIDATTQFRLRHDDSM